MWSTAALRCDRLLRFELQQEGLPMKLLRYGPPGQEKPGLLDRDGKIRDLSGVVGDVDGAALAPTSLARLRGVDPASLPLVAGTPRLGPCVGAVSKIVAIGLNYRLHAQEAGAAIPTEPIFFMKAISSICGPNDGVIIPKGSQKTDYEVELGIVIGSLARHVAQADARRHVAGYCVVNDVSEREFQIERGGQWTKGKSADTFCPIGPWLVTADEVPDPGKLALWTEVNGERRQNSNTGDLIFGVDEIVSYVSQFMTLLPGDVIPTGTPSGVGMGFKPPKFLKSGDRVRLSVEGLGEQNQRLVAYAG
jgi:2-keto-4-pentenoate hydratase/2-oxohepta-3-ene-1,7-dioic acid hydratase in catechol pathway